MTVPPSREPVAEEHTDPQPDGSPGLAVGSAWACAAIAVVAAGLRFYQLGRLSFWYDEVVTMRLARSGNPGGLVGRLFEIDATRAPLHPLLLQIWLRCFGTSEFAARSFSVLCGIATVVLVYQIGRAAFDTRTGLYAAWLAALSPILVVYSREARMYAWLVLVTCLCWRLLLALRRSFTVSKAAAYVCCLAALAYSHPLGLLMLAALAVAWLLDVRLTFGRLARWIAIHFAVTILIVPWIGHYFDHAPEFLSERLPLRFLLGTPIGFVGGNAVLLVGLVLLIAVGIIGRARDSSRSSSEVIQEAAVFLCWLILPPVTLYAYSWLFHPVFGPARYTAFVAPAYLLLVASGLSRLPVWARYPVVIGLAIASCVALRGMVYDPELKADWRDFSLELAERRSRDPNGKCVVIVASTAPLRNVEVETARYYLPADCDVIGVREALGQHARLIAANEVFYAVGSRRPSDQRVPESIGPYRFREHGRYPGLKVYLGAP
jgi:mannosyltransferase